MYIDIINVCGNKVNFDIYYKSSSIAIIHHYVFKSLIINIS